MFIDKLRFLVGSRSMLRSANIQQSTFPGQTSCHKLSNLIQMPKFSINLCKLAGRTRTIIIKMNWILNVYSQLDTTMSGLPGES